MIKKKRNLFIKLGLCISAFAGLVCALTVPSKAYTLSNNYIYSSNGLDLNYYSTCTYRNSPYYPEDGFNNDNLNILTGVDGNTGARDLYVYMTDGTNDVSFYYITPSTYDPTVFLHFDIESASNLNYLISQYSNYSLRFARMGVAGQDYMEYRLIDIINYYSLYIPLNYTYGHFGFTFRVGSINIAVPSSIMLDCVGFYFTNDVPTSAAEFEPYGVWGNTTDTLVNIESYNEGYLYGYSQRESEIIALENANRTLQQQLNTASSTDANALFWTIASTPFESFKTIWNVDVLGLNISGFVLGVLMALLILYIIKKVW